jgi:Fe-S-cluster containining protein
VSDAALRASWLEAVSRPAIRAELESIYADVASEIARRGPACWASGRCCRFDRAGHRLYVTGLEAAYVVANLDRALLPTGDGAPTRVLTLTQVEDARQRGDCPFLSGNVCGVHEIKPLGCRVYFCDRSAQVWQHELTESGLARLRLLHEREGIEYRYGEWRSMLAIVAGEAQAS